MPLDVAAREKSARSYSEDGHLHVRVSNISKAMVCPYRGNEIPNFEKLGLDPGRVYNLLRDPGELEKAAPTFNGKQILVKHVHVTADDPEGRHTVGSTGTDARFEFPYLKNSLTIWDGRGIALIENEAQRELSASYHYDPDMTPGEWRGVKYDGVMRNIRGNHVALVEDGRAGSDVVVMDSVMGAVRSTTSAISKIPEAVNNAPETANKAIAKAIPATVDPDGTHHKVSSDEDEAAYDAEFEESKVKRGEGGKFAANASGASSGMAHHAAKGAEARAAGNSHAARPHERAARAYGAALEHYEGGREEEGHASHKEAASHGRVAGGREARAAGGEKAPTNNATKWEKVWEAAHAAGQFYVPGAVKPEAAKPEAAKPIGPIKRAKDSKLAGDSQLEMRMKEKRKVVQSQRQLLVRGINIGKQLANDASAAGLSALLEALEPDGGPEPNPSPGGGPDNGAAEPNPLAVEPDVLGDPQDTNKEALGEDDDIEEKVRELLTGKLDDADLEMLLKLIRPEAATPPAEDPLSAESGGGGGEEDGGETPDPELDDQTEDALPPQLQDKEKTPVLKPAMDAAIKAASAVAVQKAVQETTRRMSALREAERVVRPWIGDVVVAMDSADAVYKLALDKCGVDVRGVHASAYPAMLKLVPKPGDAPVGSRRHVAMDAAKAKSLAERFPGMSRARVIG